MFRGNMVMKGYLKNKPATDEGVRRRLVPFRRSRRDASRRLHPAQGPLQGHHHLRRREHLLDRGRGRALQASGRAGRRRGGEARREMGRDAVRLRRAQARRAGDDRRAHRLVPQEPRRLQMPALRGVRRAAEDLDRARSRSSSCARWRRRCDAERALARRGRLHARPRQRQQARCILAALERPDRVDQRRRRRGRGASRAATVRSLSSISRSLIGLVGLPRAAGVDRLCLLAVRSSTARPPPQWWRSPGRGPPRPCGASRSPPDRARRRR